MLEDEEIIENGAIGVLKERRNEQLVHIDTN
jgi:hypothetical protein